MENGSTPSEQVELHDSRAGEQPRARTTEESGSRMDATRRSFLRGTAVAGLSALGIASASGAASAYHDEYDNVVNVVEAGADNTGSKSINPVLEDVRADNTLLEFPEGTYYMDDQFRFTRYEKFGVVGDGATIVPANYYNFGDSWPVLFRLGTRGNPGKDLRFEGMRFDQRAADTGVRVIEGNVTDRLEVRDVRVHGYHDSGLIGPGHFNVVDPNGVGRVVDFRATDGGAWTDETPHAGNTSSRGPVGIIANDNEGELMFRRCHLYGFPGSGLYAIGGDGKIIVHGGVYKNNTSASIRVGGTNSIVRWPTVVVDEPNGRNVSQRGIRIESGNASVYGAAVRVSAAQTNCHAISVMNSCTDAWIENTTIEVDSDVVNHGIVVSPDAGETTIARSEIDYTPAGGYPIWIRNSDKRDRVHGEEVRIHGEAGTKWGYRDAIRCERDNCRFNHCEIDQPGANGAERNAIVSLADDLTVYKCDLRASRWPVVELGGDTTYLDIDAESYDSREAVCLYDESHDVSIRSSRIVDGIRDYGSANLETRNNTTS